MRRTYYNKRSQAYNATLKKMVKGKTLSISKVLKWIVTTVTFNYYNCTQRYSSTLVNIMLKVQIITVSQYRCS